MSFEDYLASLETLQQHSDPQDPNVEKSDEYEANIYQEEVSDVVADLSDLEYIPSTSSEDEDDCDSVLSYSQEGQKRNRINLNSLGIIADRYRMSTDAGAVYGSECQHVFLNEIRKQSAFRGLEIESVVDMFSPISRSTLFDARVKMRIKSVADNDKDIETNHLPLKAFYFDGKKTHSIVNGRKSDRPIEHIVVMLEPGAKYMGFILPIDGTGQNISDKLVDFFFSKKIDLKDLIGIGSDGAPVNTGTQTGIIFRIENHIGKALHYLICLLHMLELLLKNLFEILDGGTANAGTYVGPIGAKFHKTEELPIGNFQKIAMGEFPDEFDHEMLTNDQRHLFELASAISEGHFSLQLAATKIGDTHEARWVTKASRILRIYISENMPSTQLVWLTKFIMFIYLPSIVNIKMKPYFFDGARHFFFIIDKIQKHKSELGPKSCQSLRSTLARNGFYSHPEMVVVAMITDQNRNIRRKGLTLIEEARARSLDSQKVVRKYVLSPTIKQVQTYVDLLPKEEKMIYEPPSTMFLTNEEIRRLKDSDQQVILPLLPSHSQNVEFHVQLMSSAADKVNSKYVDGFVLNTIKSRRNMPEYKNKKDFHPLCDEIIKELSSSSLD